ncbi:hypothetical protein C5Y96_23485 [Blastopirellula marina]|uniref:Uncharacterized protein n=1 Tax=Blastopirellula marina TaxID=124 RepID=A0A2S8F0S5_9BACT|nr:hypothetical protein C5Y96_23485 [Blastopirellula marina]RCS43458.1 hypothetical protein DTL36_23535 [Bremerella cremea]
MPKQPDPVEIIDFLKSQGALIRLRKSGQVHTLDFSGCEWKPDDQSLRHFDVLQSLEVLNCEKAPLTDAAIESILRHPGLKLMTLSGTGLSAEGIKRLRQNLIGCRIIA